MIFVYRGQLDVILADSTFRATAGASVFIPRGTWIGFRTFEKCLRALSARPGETYVPPPAPALEEINRQCDWMLKAH